MQVDEESSRSLKELANASKKIIDEGISNRSLKSEDEVFFSWKIDNFKYSDNGVSESGAHSENIVRKSWFRAEIQVEDEVKKSPHYKTTLEHLRSIHGERMTEDSLGTFIHRVISDYLHNRQFDDVKLNSMLRVPPLTLQKYMIR